ncbi:MAG: hypothetical protein M9964_12040 [Solirubrobacterales bacterium]|nr:hypothetical protein [Solirubrobacterales bacterium]
MQVQQEENRDGGEVVEAQLRLDEGDVISGEIVGAGGSRRFHGWLELMDALDALRLPALRDRQEV